ncbi:hypothetical protein DVR12_03275 [Chitinophaga silvatica]|uniref:DoxX family protein n=1 Tax=Chitinophaga silvatica TaxID=2282649 RepID=A0A3E1YHU7_9BACT|nr:hypothetical protein [Chitinophaga silvatica]RFS26820.1 hypothetical protein DVR12_03275 [Chitinophaga silvatica]
MTSTEQWTLSRRLLFRFFSVYFLMYAISSMIPTGGNDSFLTHMWDHPVTWLGKLLISSKYEIKVWPRGSGDTTFNYLQIGCMLIITLLINIIWWLIERKKRNYEKQEYVIRTILRFILAFVMLEYGVAKLVANQFIPVMNYQLDQQIKDLSPMGLAWLYMGHSTAYMYFAGIAEVIGGVLLLFRRTTLFGTLFSMAVMANVVAMNFCFDIPVKIFSSHLLLVGGFLIAPELNRLIAVFFQNKTAAPANYWYPSPKKKIVRIILVSVRYLIIVGLLGGNIYSIIKYNLSKKADTPLAGSYEITKLQGAGNLPADVTLFKGWKKMYVESMGYLIARDSGNSISGYYLKIDTVKHHLTAWTNEKDSIQFHYEEGPEKQLKLVGSLNQDTLFVDLVRQDRDSTVLLGRGFHWVNEYPFNR